MGDAASRDIRCQDSSITGRPFPPQGFPGGSVGKESAYKAGDPGSIPGSRRSPGEGNGNPLQYCCLEKPMRRGACSWGRKELDAIERLTLSLSFSLEIFFPLLRSSPLARFSLRSGGLSRPFCLYGGCCSVTKLCLTLFNPMDCSTPGLPVLHHLPEFAQAHVH